ncbi:hypothetical protein RRG08_009253 [Elysia crispata]|uniref:Uncharacterized protein n=1 Tax=Elysia crispata TaxID=231223 RepID=A0AAE1B047_9GAST|nr:hypothetical protein RRG08_009253 [Elysia crispata]
MKLVALAVVCVALVSSVTSTGLDQAKLKELIPLGCEAFDTLHTLLGCNTCSNHFCVAIEFGLSTCNELSGLGDSHLGALQDKLKVMLFDATMSKPFEGRGLNDFLQRWTEQMK